MMIGAKITQIRTSKQTNSMIIIVTSSRDNKDRSNIT